MDRIIIKDTTRTIQKPPVVIYKETVRTIEGPTKTVYVDRPVSTPSSSYTPRSSSSQQESLIGVLLMILGIILLALYLSAKGGP